MSLSLLLAAVFVFGLARLFELRFDQGDLYPPYSTLRSDPLGASVLYESLERVPGLTARRHFEATFAEDAGRGRDLFLLGVRPAAMHWVDRSEFDTLQRFVFNGGRVVFAYFPEVSPSWKWRREQTNEAERLFPDRKKPIRPVQQKGDSKKPEHAAATNRLAQAEGLSDTNRLRGTNAPSSSDNDDEADWELEKRNHADVCKVWGFDFAYHPLGTNESGALEFPSAARISGDRALPARIAMHTMLCFTNLAHGWTTLYQRDLDKPVLIERRFGAGSVVLVADTYPVSNEAMFKDRNAALLSWLLGGGREIDFDEAHLGLVERPGIATLMRRYRLHGLIFSLLAVAALFVWKNATSLVPPYTEPMDRAGLVIAGRDSASGFVNLLRRGVAPADLIQVGYAEWQKSGARRAALSPAQRREMEELIQKQAALEPRRRQPVETYRSLSRLLRRKP